jgi:hypothetical protein
MTIFGRNDTYTEGMTIIWKEWQWQGVFFEKNLFFGLNISSISFITFARS